MREALTSCKSCIWISSKFWSCRERKIGHSGDWEEIESGTRYRSIARLRSSSFVVVRVDGSSRCNWDRTAIKIEVVILLGPLAREYGCWNLYQH